MMLLRIVKIGLLSPFALALLIGCATGEVRRVDVVEIPRPVLQRVPAERVEEIEVPPFEGEINGDLLLHISELEERLRICNIDRAWIRNRQRPPEE